MPQGWKEASTKSSSSAQEKMMDLEAKKHLHHGLFHGVRKHTHNSIWYLYGTPGMSYSQLMLAALKAESKNKETWDRVRDKVTVTTKLLEGAVKLKQQFAKLMAAPVPGSVWQWQHQCPK